METAEAFFSASSVEWVEWEAGEAIVVLAGGRRVIAHDGDEFLLAKGDGWSCFVDHRKRQIH